MDNSTSKEVEVSSQHMPSVIVNDAEVSNPTQVLLI